MSGTLVAVTGILLCSVLLAVLLRGQRPELALCLGMAAGVLVVLLLLRQTAPLLATVRRMLQAADFPSVYLTTVLKAAGITLLTADTCRDAGESALAAKAELAGRILLLALAVPLFEQILTLVTAMMNGQAVSGG